MLAKRLTEVLATLHYNATGWLVGWLNDWMTDWVTVINLCHFFLPQNAHKASARERNRRRSCCKNKQQWQHVEYKMQPSWQALECALEAIVNSYLPSLCLVPRGLRHNSVSFAWHALKTEGQHSWGRATDWALDMFCLNQHTKAVNRQAIAMQTNLSMLCFYLKNTSQSARLES